MTRDESLAVYDRARVVVEQLRAQLGDAGLGERMITGLATRGERSASNKAAHKLAQFERAASTRPTLKQRQLLYALGYRGPIPANRAEVTTLLNALGAERDRRALRLVAPQ